MGKMPAAILSPSKPTFVCFFFPQKSGVTTFFLRGSKYNHITSTYSCLIIMVLGGFTLVYNRKRIHSEQWCISLIKYISAHEPHVAMPCNSSQTFQFLLEKILCMWLRIPSAV